jgi:hypothetical protein
VIVGDLAGTGAVLPEPPGLATMPETPSTVEMPGTFAQLEH